MGSDWTRKDTLLVFLIFITLVIGGGLFASVLNRRTDESTAELQLLFDLTLLKHHVGLFTDYGERPHPPPLSPNPPNTENHYQPNLEDEYY